MTQARPTNFHGYWRKKVLVGAETPGDFREITDDEKSALERSDAAWVPWPQSFIDLWNAAWAGFGGYNPETGYGEGNGLVDITYPQALDIYYAGKIPGYYGVELYTRNSKIRTNLPAVNSYSRAVMTRAFLLCTKLEVANLKYARIGKSTFSYCSKLRKIIGQCMDSINENLDGCFNNCYALEEIEDLTINYSSRIDFSDCPLLNLITFERIVSKYRNASQCIITLHPEVYAKLTDEENAEWHQVMTDAAAKNIIFATV